MNLEHWKSQADSHWKEFQPTRYKALIKEKKLGEALDEAVEATYRETSELEAEGFNPEEAFQMVRERYLFPPEEPGRTKESEPTRGAELMMDTQKLKNEIQEIATGDYVVEGDEESPDPQQSDMQDTEILIEIEDITKDQENAIRSHGPAMTSLFMENKSDLPQRVGLQWKLLDENSVIANRDDLQRLDDFVCVSSFISAWYHLSKNITNRDKAAHSCATLISSLGFHPDKVFYKYMKIEKIWRSYLKKSGLAPRI